MMQRAKLYAAVSRSTGQANSLDEKLISHLCNFMLRAVHSIKPLQICGEHIYDNKSNNDAIKRHENKVSKLRVNKCLQDKLSHPKFYSTFCSDKKESFENDESNTWSLAETAVDYSIKQSVSSEEILTLTESYLNAGTLQPQHISAILVKFKTLVYKELIDNYRLTSELNQRKQLELNLLNQQLLNEHIMIPEFDNLLNYTEASLHLLSLHQCVLILNSLHWLQLTLENKCLYRLYLQCCEKIHLMNFHQLTLFSCSLSNSSDFPVLSQVAEKAKKLVLEDSSAVNLNDLCVLFANIQKIVSPDYFVLCAKKMLHIVNESPTLENMIKLSLFADISKNECMDVVINGLLNFSPESFESITVDRSHITLDIAVDINGATWLSPTVRKIASFCAHKLSSDQMLSKDEIVMYSLINLKLPYDNFKAAEKISTCIKWLDNYLFIEFLKHYLNMKHLPKSLALAFHDRLVLYLKELDSRKLTHLDTVSDDQLTSLLFHYHCKFIDMGITVDKSIRNMYNRITEIDLTELSWTPFQLELVLNDALAKLESDIALYPASLNQVLKILRWLELDTLMKLNRDLESLIYKNNSKLTNFQSSLLRKTVCEIFNNRLNHSIRLTPALCSRKALPPTLVYEKKLGLLEPLLNSLPRMTQDKEEINCIRALRVLELTSDKFPVYQKDTFENLLAFLKSNTDVCVYSTFQLIKAISFANYTPEDLNSFITICEKHVENVLKKDLLEKRLQVELAYSLSLYALYFDDMLSRIFSLKFLTSLEEEFKDLSFKGGERIKAMLTYLSRNVALECPHLSLYRTSFLTHKDERDRNIYAEKLRSSLSRICGDDSWIHVRPDSHYTHSIDAVLYLQAKKLVKPDVGQEKLKAGEDIDRVAVQYLGKNQFCVNSDHLTGKTVTKIRQLEMLGYTVVLVSYKEISSMELQSEHSLDNFVVNKINTSLGFPLLH